MTLRFCIVFYCCSHNQFRRYKIQASFHSPVTSNKIYSSITMLTINPNYIPNINFCKREKMIRHKEGYEYFAAQGTV